MTDNDCFVSFASMWEMSIKFGLRYLNLPAPIEKYIPEQMHGTGSSNGNSASSKSPAWRHCPGGTKDPFDRLLAAQAAEEKLTSVSRDPVFDSYGIKRIW